MIVLAKKCPNCGKVTEVIVTEEAYNRWQSGEHVQSVWPDKTPDERELMMTGICNDKCWHEYLGPEE
jgi:hypothetical protein